MKEYRLAEAILQIKCRITDKECSKDMLVQSVTGGQSGVTFEDLFRILSVCSTQSEPGRNLALREFICYTYNRN